jgi:hypothetical protein
VVDPRLVFGPFNPNALVHKVMSNLSQYKSQTAVLFIEVGNG